MSKALVEALRESAKASKRVADTTINQHELDWHLGSSHAYGVAADSLDAAGLVSRDAVVAHLRLKAEHYDVIGETEAATALRWQAAELEAGETP